ncbi:DNA-processing protein DprA [Moraxella haemolytica]|uniref:DNA-processing protein DprA n=1 Tax=Moraxella haemolytica TaxID=2904119 RepID=UPI0025431086|nr:DNA-processing protein DprA [Moraxella sp. ZY171148]WII95280.1 DNA-processing protein DprA [Moraxella sp. ZY171148]
MTYQNLNSHEAVLALWYIVNTSLSSYYKLIDAYDDAHTALLATKEAWQSLSIHVAHLKRFEDSSDVLAFVGRVYDEVSRGAYGLLFMDDDDYPEQLQTIYDPPPVLFYRGEVARLTDRQIAIVGSRNPTEHARKITFDLAQYLVQSGFSITSGLAQGVDREAHLGALSQDKLKGCTIGVMGTGIDVCYPKNHNALFAQIIAQGGVLITELLPSTPASKHTFPRRNRLVAGLSLATVVTEAALQSGSLITARLTAEQGKQVFAVPSYIDNKNAEGCHHLIREGATLIYHPDQIIEDVCGGMPYNALPKSFSKGVSAFIDATTDTSQETAGRQTQTSAITSEIPSHLSSLMQCIELTPKDLDTLVAQTGMDIGMLLAQLVELELLGLITSVGGRYGRV